MNKKHLLLIPIVCVLLFLKYYVLDGSLQSQSIQSVQSKVTTIQNGNTKCASYLNRILYKTVDDTFIDDLKRLCYNTSYRWTGESFDNYFLDHSINNLDCPETAKFLKARRPSVALASFPGSGNTWTRHLLEIVTGIHTGSVYSTKREIGPKVCPVNGPVFIVKTHGTDDKINHSQCKKIHLNKINFTKVIYIVRNPYDTIIAEFNRQETHSMNITSAERFKSTVFRKRVHSLTERWKSMMEYWLTKTELPRYVIVYERQLSQPLLEMFQIMKFLDFPVKAKSLLCLSKLTVKRRQKPDWLMPSNLYDDELRSIVNKVINEVIEIIGTETEIGKVIQNYTLI